MIHQSLLGREGLGSAHALCSTECSTWDTNFPEKTATVIAHNLPAGSGGTMGRCEQHPTPSPSLHTAPAKAWLVFSSEAVAASCGACASCHHRGLEARGRFLLLPPQIPRTKLLVAAATVMASWFLAGEDNLIFK